MGIQGVDLIELVEQFKDLYFTYAIKYICDICGYNYYNDFNKEENSQLLEWLDKVENIGSYSQDLEILKPLPKQILEYYLKYPNMKFLNDHINKQTQQEFEIGFDLYSGRITIPVYDELGSLIGVKGRAWEDDIDDRYLALYPYPKTKILYGLNKTLLYIQKEKGVIIFEAEKSVMQAWSYGIKNTVALGGKTISETQIQKILQLNVPVIFALDKGVAGKEINALISEFTLFTDAYVIYDKREKLEDKNSPTDKGREIFEFLLENKYKIN